jgi:hypothetical protein
MSVFNPETFMDSTLTAPNATKVEGVPPGEYQAVVDDEIKPPKVVTTKTGETMVFFEVPFNIQDEALKAKLGRDKLQVRHSVRLDIDESGALDMGKGKNVGLGRLREALGMNDGPFIPRALAGKGPVTVSVQYQKGSTEYTEVNKVGRAS